MFNIEMMAAEQGDALWLEYGDSSKPRVVAIDGGPQKEGSPLLARMRERTVGGAQLCIELLIITHIDADHINGVLAALRHLPPGVTIGDVWFNGFEHLMPPDQLGEKAGDELSKHLQESGLPWNRAFNEGAVVVRPGKALPRIPLAGGLELTLLSPTPEKLAALHGKWRSVLVNARVATDNLGQIPSVEQESGMETAEDFLGAADIWPPDVQELAARSSRSDAAQANGSSIGVLASYRNGGNDRAVLLAADCHASVLESSIARLLVERREKRLRLDAFKLPHHGSRYNLTNALLTSLRCSRYLVSTNGTGRASHPDYEALARVVVHGGPRPRLLFNYRTPQSSNWARALVGAPAYTTEYGDGTLTVSLD